jgi:hypothetical protein
MAAAARHPEDFGQWRTNDAPRHAEPVAAIVRPALNLRALIPAVEIKNPEPAAAIIDAWLRSCGDPSKFTVDTVLELMQ